MEEVAGDASCHNPHAKSREWREMMAEAIAEAEAEGVMEEYEDLGNTMNKGTASAA